MPDFNVCGYLAAPVNVFFLSFSHTTVYTFKTIFTLARLDLVFIKNTLLSRVVFYLCVCHNTVCSTIVSHLMLKMQFVRCFGH